MLKLFYFFLTCFLMFSCQKKENQSTQNQENKPLLSVVSEHPSPEKILPEFKKNVENWEELNAVNSFLSKFKKTSPNEVLSNALELKELVKSLKDSVKPAVFNTPSLTARINILENETLRLADLTFIPAITANEINIQTNKTLAAFSAVNAKINTILSKKRFEEEVEINLDFIGIDSTKIDSISKKSIDKQLKERLLQDKEKKTPSKNLIGKKNFNVQENKKR